MQTWVYIDRRYVYMKYKMIALRLTKPHANTHYVEGVPSSTQR